MLETLQSETSTATAAGNHWDHFVGQHPAAHPLQSSGWGVLKGRFGWRSATVAIPEDEVEPQAGALLLYRTIAGLTLAYAPRGPLTDWHNQTLTRDLLAALCAACRRQGAALLKIEPGLLDTPANRTLLAGYGFRPSPHTIQPPSTILVDLGEDDATILQRMKSKWRYNIRLAERKGVTVRTATRADLPAFTALMAQTGLRDGFAVHSPDYYTAAFDLLTPQSGTFLLAEYEDRPLAGLVVAVCGAGALYLWGASGEEERNRMPNYALQWAAIRYARARGARQYDLWGIPDELGQLTLALTRGQGGPLAPEALPIDLEALPSSGLWGVYRFKQGFGGQVVRTVGAWDLPINELGYGLYRFGLRAKEISNGIRKRIAPATGRRQPGGDAPGVDPGATPNPTHSTPARAQLQLAPLTSATAWRDALAVVPTSHVLQSWEWGEIKRQTGWRAEHFALSSGGRPVAAWQLLCRQLAPGLPLRIGYLPKGPLLDWADSDLVEATLAQIEDIARQRGCIFVKIDPDVAEDSLAGRRLQHALGRRGWRYSADQIQFKNTAFTDLTLDEVSLLAGMKQKWRYNIRLAERRGVRIRQGVQADLAQFYGLYRETGRRDGFLVRPLAYYQTTWETFLAAQEDPHNPAGAALLLADHPADAQPVAGVFVLRYGPRAWYFNGASSERHRRDMPNYLLQWDALRWAKDQGCLRYDWWGAPTQLDNAADPLQGVWQFKQGFGARFQPHTGAWDFPVFPPLYQLYLESMPQVIAWLKRRRRP